MGGVTRVGGVALAAVLLAGCGGGDNGHENGKGGGPDATNQAEPLAKLSVPSAYDAAKGWDEALNWVPESVGTLPVSVVPSSGAVAMMYAASNGYTVKVRAADSGQVRWTSAPWNPPTQVDGAEGDPEYGEAAEIPDVTGIEQDGHGYVVAYAHGMRGKDDLHEGTEVVRLAVYPVDASGSSAKPLRQIDVPVSADPGEVQVSSVEAGGCWSAGARRACSRGGLLLWMWSPARLPIMRTPTLFCLSARQRSRAPAAVSWRPQRTVRWWAWAGAASGYRAAGSATMCARPESTRRRGF